MPLANCNVQALVTEQIKHYLSKSKPTFLELKIHILSKAPIPEIHSKIVDLLTQSKETDQLQVQKALETQAYKQQLAEDEQQKKHDLEEESKDDLSKNRLTKQINKIPTQLNHYESEIRVLELKMSRLMREAPNTEVTQNTRQNIKKISNPAYEAYLLSIEKVKSALLSCEMKIQSLLLEQHTMSTQLRDLETRIEERAVRHRLRAKRAQARTGYLSSGEGLVESLASKNHAQLSKSCAAQQAAIEKKCDLLIYNAAKINFTLFIQEVENSLTELSLIAQEYDALRVCIKFLKQHLDFANQAATTEDHLNIQKQHINSQTLTLQKAKTNLNSLVHANPNVTYANNLLLLQNEELSKSQKNHNSTNYKLSTPALFLLALTCLLTIPLILTVFGVIPFFMAPALVYTLVSVPPALSLLTTTGLGIASLVYAHKATTNKKEIESNLNTIETNKTKMQDNTENINQLQTTTIPKIQAQIKKDEDLKEQLELSLKKSQNQALQALRQAQEAKPLAPPKSPIIDSAQESALSDSDDENQDEMIMKL